MVQDRIVRREEARLPEASLSDLRERVRTPERDVPPEGIAPHEVGLLTTGQAQVTDMAAFLVGLVVEGQVEVVPDDVLHGLGTRRRHTWRLVRPGGAPEQSLDEDTRRLLDVMFVGRRTTHLLVLPDVARGHSHLVTAGWESRLTARGMGRRASTWAACRQAAGITAPVGIVLMLAAGQAAAITPATFVACLAMGVSPLAVGAVLHVLGPRESGSEVVTEQIEGFTRHLMDARAETFAGPDGAALFTRYLPWAVATGALPWWGRAFSEALEGRGADGRLSAVPVGPRTEGGVPVAWVEDLAWLTGAEGRDGEALGFCSTYDALDSLVTGLGNTFRDPDRNGDEAY